MREDVKALAYHLWNKRGCPIGDPEIDWHEAEKHLDEAAKTLADQRGRVRAATKTLLQQWTFGRKS